MRICSKCKLPKRRSDFYKDGRRPNGLLSWCKECMRIAKNKWAEKNVGHSREYARDYYYENYKERKKKHRAFMSTPKMKKKSMEYWNRSRQRADYPLKDRARNKVEKALESGKLVRLPCQICGNSQSEAHHPDYSKPLDVLWLCRDHHAKEHRKYVQAAA